MRYYLSALTLVLLISACKTVPHKKVTQLDHVKDMAFGDVFATAVLEEKSGSKVRGYAVFSKSKEGLHVMVSLNDAKPGFHGIHIHEHGDCSSMDASSAGGHFNPTKLKHGDPNPKKHHIGDLGNIVVSKDGYGVLSLAIPASRFNKKFSDWTKIIGKSLIIHGGTDDLETQPTGDSGNRIACGIIGKI